MKKEQEKSTMTCPQHSLPNKAVTRFHTESNYSLDY